MGLRFPNPVGLAAGFDRDGKLIGQLAPAGFGFVEVGTINVDSEAAPQKSELTDIVHTLHETRLRSRTIGSSTDRQLLGISLGSRRDIPDEFTIADYLKGIELFWQYADYLVVNLSRPGSPGRILAPDITALHFLLKEVKHKQTVLTTLYKSRVPIIIKLALEYQNDDTIPSLVYLVREMEFDGILVAFENWSSRKDIIKCIRKISDLIQPLPLIVVGGIRTTDDARQSLEAGANLVQLFTGLVDKGPLQTRKMISTLVDSKPDCL